MESMQTTKPDGSGLWAIVLAAGQGSRLRAMTTLDGQTVPKQFCALRGDVSMLRHALQRAAWMAPGTQVRVVVGADHRRWWEKELDDLPAASVVVQPRDRGTAAGALLPLMGVLRQDPEGTVVILPADHHVENESVLQAAIRQGVAMVEDHPERVILLGITAQEENDSEFGWIVADRRRAPIGPALVEQFREKPGAVEAAALKARGALINSFVLVARASSLWALYEERLPDLAAPFGRWEGGSQGLGALYERIPSHDLSRDVLEPSIGRLWVVPVAPCGWSDLGTPERVARCLESSRRAAFPASALPPPRRGFVPPLNLSRRLVAAHGAPPA